MDVGNATVLPTSELPQEILQMIINYLPGSALNNVRLSSKALKFLAEPRLFERMVLVPYVDCLEGFANMTRNNPIARYVQMLHYGAESRWDSSWVVPEEEFEQTTTQSGADWRLENHVLSFHGQTTEVLLLSNCFRKLPALGAIHV